MLHLIRSTCLHGVHLIGSENTCNRRATVREGEKKKAVEKWSCESVLFLFSSRDSQNLPASFCSVLRAATIGAVIARIKSDKTHCLSGADAVRGSLTGSWHQTLGG